MATQAEIDEIVEYYGNLLIIQYHNKPKAKAMVELFVRTLIADGIILDVRDAYDVETAIGVQLDVIGKYVDVDRFFKVLELDGYFSFAEYSDVSYTGKIGFSEYSDFETKEGKWLTYAGVTSTGYALNDEEFRIIIKLRIVQNNSNHSHKSIDDSMFEFFGDSVIPLQTGNMAMQYLVPEELSPILTVAIQKEVLPRPMGVSLELTTQFSGIFIVEGRESFESSVTFTRASVANMIDATGVLVEKSINIPRFTYT